MSRTGLDKASLLFAGNKLARALREVENFLQGHPASVEGYLLKATILSHHRKHKEALDIVKMVLAKHPSSNEALLTKAEICFLARKDRQALKIFYRVAKRTRITREERRYLFWQWINALIENKRWQTAKRVLKEALRRFPNDNMLSFYGALVRKATKSA